MASRSALTLLLPFLALNLGLAQIINPLASQCSPNLPNVACVNNFAAVMPLPFSRPASFEGTYNLADRFNNTLVNDPSFGLVRNASFVVFNKEKGLKLLGPSPTLETIFLVANVIHEAPVYVPGLNAIIASEFDQNTLDQIIINLNNTPPTISLFKPNPPVFAVNGGRYLNGKVYWAVAGGDAIVNGTIIHQAPGIYTLNPFTRATQPILNNYFGQRFNSPNDLVLDSAGDIFFTDPIYGVALNVTQSPPVLRQQSYRFRPSTGAVAVIEAEIAVPNGIALSPDEKTLYITDTGVTNFTNLTSNVGPRFTYVTTGPKSIYAFDTVNSPAGKYFINKRPIWYAQECTTDGFHVASNGFLVGATGLGVDVLTPFGELVVRIQTDFLIGNIQFAGPELSELWLFGIGKIARVKWALTGLPGARS